MCSRERESANEECVPALSLKHFVESQFLYACMIWPLVLHWLLVTLVKCAQSVQAFDFPNVLMVHIDFVECEASRSLTAQTGLSTFLCL